MKVFWEDSRSFTLAFRSDCPLPNSLVFPDVAMDTNAPPDAKGALRRVPQTNKCWRWFDALDGVIFVQNSGTWATNNTDDRNTAAILVDDWKSVEIENCWRETMTDANGLSDTSRLKLNYIDESEEELIEEVSKVLKNHTIYLRELGNFNGISIIYDAAEASLFFYYYYYYPQMLSGIILSWVIHRNFLGMYRRTTNKNLQFCSRILRTFQRLCSATWKRPEAEQQSAKPSFWTNLQVW